MATTTLDKVLEDVQTLTPNEQFRLREMLDALLQKQSDQAKQEELDRRLLAAGLLTRIPPPITDFTPYERWQPVEIEGEPISETIIRERR